MNAAAKMEPPPTVGIAEQDESDHLVAANGPDVATLHDELRRAQETIVQMRSPLGVIRMAVQMLQGPLKHLVSRLEGRDRFTVESMLASLEDSTRQACDAVASPFTVRPSSNAPLPKHQPAAASPRAKGPPAVEPSPSTTPRKASGPVDVAELLSRLEVLVVTRSAYPALVAVDAASGLRLDVESSELLRVLSQLVEACLEAAHASAPGSGGPWTVGLRAYEDPAEVLGDEIDVVLEVRGQGAVFAPEVVSWMNGVEGARRQEASTESGLQAVRDRVSAWNGTMVWSQSEEEAVIVLRIPRAEIEVTPKRARRS